MFDFLVFPKSPLILHQVITLVKGQFFRCFGKIFMFAGGRGPPAHGLPIRFSSFSEHSGAENKACCRACKKQKIACCIRSIACPWHFLRIPWFFRFVWLFRLFGSPRFFRLIRLFTDGDGLLSFFVCHRKIKAMREHLISVLIQNPNGFHAAVCLFCSFAFGVCISVPFKRFGLLPASLKENSVFVSVRLSPLTFGNS